MELVLSRFLKTFLLTLFIGLDLKLQRKKRYN